MADSKYLDCEVFVSGRDQARLSIAGRDYVGRTQLDKALERRLNEAALEPKRYGSLLFDAVFSAEKDGLRDGYRESLTLARHQGQRLRLRLHIAATAPLELHSLGWELLYDEAREIALGRSQDMALSRYLGAAFEPGTAVVGPPRLLVVLSCPRDLADFGLPDLDHSKLRRSAEEALQPLQGLVSYKFLDGPITLQSLRDRLVEEVFHALHWVGHGLLSLDGSACLMFEDSEGRVEVIHEQRFAEAFEGLRELRLVTLMACHSGIPTEADPFSGLAPALVRRNIAAVIAMRRQISVVEAEKFTQHLYRNLARSGQIDVAVNESRLQLYLADPEASEWATPTLFMHLQDGLLWDIRPVEDQDLETQAQRSESTVLRTLLASGWQEPPPPQIQRLHDQLMRELMRHHGVKEVEKSDGFLLLFERPVEAVRFALDYHQALQAWQKEKDVEFAVGVGLHLGEILLLENSSQDIAAGARTFEVTGEARKMARRLLLLAKGQQTLLTRAVFDVARQSLQDDAISAEALLWLAHGEYVFQGAEDPVEIFEVGIEGLAPLQAPEGIEGARQALGQETILGWRPAPGLTIPQRPHWQVENKLGAGGFGEVWLAVHRKTDDRRVFKFCYDASRLKALQREITLFRLLKEELGHRADIARILDWNFEHAPYFIESEYAADGNLIDWAEAQGGIGQVSLPRRLDICSQVATALAAAHSVGVLHKDVKPSNVLIAEGEDGTPRIRLCDFGIGTVTERQRLSAAGITVMGLTTETDDGSSSGSGTRLYSAPEILEGKRTTLQADIFALGVMLYQMIAGDFTRALAPGWRRDVQDTLLCEDIAVAVDRSPDRRLGDAQQVAERLRSLESRRTEQEAAQRRQEDAERALVDLAKARHRRNLFAVAGVVLTIFAAAMALQMRRVAREAETSRQISGFLVDLFRASDPDHPLGQDITALEVFDRGAQRIETELRNQREVQARLQNVLGIVYQGLGDYDQAIEMLKKALSTRKRIFGESHLEVAETLHALGEAYWYSGDVKAAETPAREALEMRNRLLGKNNLEIASSCHNVAWILLIQGKLDEAEPFVRTALRIRTSLLGEHLDVAGSKSALAALLQAKRSYEAAEPLYIETLAMRRRLLREENRDDDREVATVLNNLGLLLRTTGRYSEAQPVLRESLKLHRKILGNEHPEVATSLNNLALNLHLMMDLESAEPLYREALSIRRRVFGEENTRVASTLNNLAALLHLKGDLEDAESLHRQALDIRQSVHGEDHLDVIGSLTNLARVLIDTGDAESAEPLLRQALERTPRAFPDGHWRVDFAYGVFGGCLSALGQYAEAEPLLLESYPKLAATTGAGSLYTQEILQHLIALYDVWGKPDSAAEYRTLVDRTADP